MIVFILVVVGECFACGLLFACYDCLFIVIDLGLLCDLWVWVWVGCFGFFSVLIASLLIVLVWLVFHYLGFRVYLVV